MHYCEKALSQLGGFRCDDSVCLLEKKTSFRCMAGNWKNVRFVLFHFWRRMPEVEAHVLFFGKLFGHYCLHDGCLRVASPPPFPPHFSFDDDDDDYVTVFFDRLLSRCLSCFLPLVSCTRLFCSSTACPALWRAKTLSRDAEREQDAENICSSRLLSNDAPLGTVPQKSISRRDSTQIRKP